LFAYAVISIFAVMVELLHAAFAGFAVVAVLMNPYVAFWAENQEIGITARLWVGLGDEAGVDRVGSSQTAVVDEDEDEGDVEEDEHEDEN
jgi:hypothetical protein